MKRLVVLVPLALGACQTINPQIASADAKLRDKCDYLRSGVAIAQAASAFYPPAIPIVAAGSDYIARYCSGTTLNRQSR